MGNEVLVVGWTLLLSSSALVVNSADGLDDSDIALILKYHNLLRQYVSFGYYGKGDSDYGYPTGMNMHKMFWDQELADSAQDWANQCKFEHDTRESARGAGENLASLGIVEDEKRPQQLVQGLRLWKNEISAKPLEGADLSYKSDNLEATGHFTQMIWWNTTHLGCGINTCTEAKFTLFVCRYTPQGNVKGDSYYAEGFPCDACRDGAESGSVCAQGETFLCIKKEDIGKDGAGNNTVVAGGDDVLNVTSLEGILNATEVSFINDTESQQGNETEEGYTVPMPFDDNNTTAEGEATTSSSNGTVTDGSTANSTESSMNSTAFTESSISSTASTDNITATENATMAESSTSLDNMNMTTSSSNMTLSDSSTTPPSETNNTPTASTDEESASSLDTTVSEESSGGTTLGMQLSTPVSIPPPILNETLLSLLDNATAEGLNGTANETTGSLERVQPTDATVVLNDTTPGDAMTSQPFDDKMSTEEAPTTEDGPAIGSTTAPPGSTTEAIMADSGNVTEPDNGTITTANVSTSVSTTMVPVEPALKEAAGAVEESADEGTFDTRLTFAVEEDPRSFPASLVVDVETAQRMPPPPLSADGEPLPLPFSDQVPRPRPS